MTNLKLDKLLLLAAFSSASLALGLSLLPVGTHSGSLPDTVPLTTWQTLARKDLAVPKNLEAIAKRYTYQKEGKKLNVDSFYIMNRANGDVEVMLKQVTKISLKPNELKIQEKTGLGFYVTFERDRQAYLSTCINPLGGSTVTTRQFLANRNHYDFTAARFVTYALGISDLRDKRCLWLTFSTPLTSDRPATFQQLESAWQEWVVYWQPRFL